MGSQLTPAQLQTLKAGILADPELAAEPADSNGSYSIMLKLNMLASPTVTAWRTDAPTAAIMDAIDWTKYTPSDTADNTATYTNRLLLVQTKQMNLQNIIVGRETVDASKANVRAGLRDAVIALPTGANGISTTAGGASAVNVMNALTRPITRGEQIFMGAEVTTGSVTARLLAFQGDLTHDDIKEARAA